MEKKIEFIKNEENLKLYHDAMDMRTIRNINEILQDVVLQKQYTQQYDNKLYLGLIDEQKEKYEKIKIIIDKMIKSQKELIKELEEARAYIIGK